MWVSALTNVWTYRTLWLLLGWLLIFIVIYFSLIPQPPQPLAFAFADKLSHLFSYAILAGWFTQLYTTARVQAGWLIGFVLLGVALELLQGWGGLRLFEFADMAANSLGVLVGWWLSRTWCRGWLLWLDRRLAGAQ